MTAIDLRARARTLPIAESFIALVIATLFAALLSGVLLAVNYAAALAPRAPIVSAVQEGFADKSLQDEAWLRLNADIGAHQFNDCLVLLMTADDRTPAIQRAFSPTIAGANVGEEGRAVESPCPALRELAAGNPTPLTPDDHYHRYVHGQVAFAALVLQVLDVSQARAAFAFASFLLTAGLFAFAAFRLVRQRADAFPVTDALIALFGLLFTTNFGVQYFGKSFGHFPADAVIYLYLWAVLLLQPHLRKSWIAAALSAAFGVLTMYFEMLTGGLPLGACLVLCVSAAMAMDAKEQHPLARAAVVSIAYGAGVIAMYGIKMAATIAVFGDAVFGGASSRLTSWIGGAWPWTVAKQVLSDTEYFAGGATWLGVSMLVGASIALIASLYMLARKRSWDDAPYWILAAAALSIPIWWCVMAHHTMVHSWFMVRIAVGYIGASLFLWAALNRAMLAAVLERLMKKLRPA